MWAVLGARWQARSPSVVGRNSLDLNERAGDGSRSMDRHELTRMPRGMAKKALADFLEEPDVRNVAHIDRRLRKL